MHYLFGMLHATPDTFPSEEGLEIGLPASSSSWIKVEVAFYKEGLETPLADDWWINMETTLMFCILIRHTV
jgi:hypothetical protein